MAASLSCGLSAADGAHLAVYGERMSETGAAVRVVVMRHGHAEPRSASVSEWERTLTPRGRAEAAYLGEVLRGGECRPGLLLHSPLVRAMQTAEIVAAACGAALRVAQELALDAPVGPVATLIERERGGAAVLGLVGHNPRLEELVAVLCPDVRGRGVSLGTGEAVVIEVAAGARAAGGGVAAARIRLAD